MTDRLVHSPFSGWNRTLSCYFLFIITIQTEGSLLINRDRRSPPPKSQRLVTILPACLPSRDNSVYVGSRSLTSCSPSDTKRTDCRSRYCRRRCCCPCPRRHRCRRVDIHWTHVISSHVSGSCKLLTLAFGQTTWLRIWSIDPDPDHENREPRTQPRLTHRLFLWPSFSPARRVHTPRQTLLPSSPI